MIAHVGSLWKRAFFLFSACCCFRHGFAVPAQTAADADESWLQELLKERQQKDIEFKTSPTSPMAGSERLTCPRPEKTFITIRDGSCCCHARAGAGTVFAVFSQEGKWYWDDAAAGVTCRLGGTRHRPAPTRCRREPVPVGRFTLAVYPGADTLALIVFDPQRPQLLDFEHLLYFPPDPAYAVKARLEKFPEKREVKIITTRKLEKTFYRYARVHFQLQGRELELTALKSSLEGPDARYPVHPFQGR